MGHHFPLGLVAALAGALAGCGDSSGPGGNQSFRATDPSGDTFGSQTVQPDLTAYTIVRDTGGIDVLLDFTANVQSPVMGGADRKSTRLNSSHGYISYAVFCLKKKNK